MGKRVDYYHDPAAPQANSLVVGSSAVVVDDEGRVLLQRRSDSGNWALPGGAMDIGETFAESAVREVKEETGFDVRIERIVGVYSDPAHVFAYSDGEVRQEFNICLAAAIVGGELAVSRESTDVRFVPLDEVAGLTMHQSIRKRIDDYLSAAPPVLRLGSQRASKPLSGWQSLVASSPEKGRLFWASLVVARRFGIYALPIRPGTLAQGRRDVATGQRRSTCLAP